MSLERAESVSESAHDGGMKTIIKLEPQHRVARQPASVNKPIEPGRTCLTN